MLLAERNLLDSAVSMGEFFDPSAEFKRDEKESAESVHMLARTGHIEHSISDLLYVSLPFLMTCVTLRVLF